jgi:hypothetical protein
LVDLSHHGISQCPLCDLRQGRTWLDAAKWRKWVRYPVTNVLLNVETRSSHALGSSLVIFPMVRISRNSQ